MDNLFTREQLAAEIGVSTKTIERWEKKGLPVIRITSRFIRYDIDAAKTWVKSRETSAGEAG